jgi:hypothetical protein
VTAADWIGVAALAVAPTLAMAGVIYRAGKLTSSVDDLARRVGSLEEWMRGRQSRYRLLSTDNPAW